MLMQEELKQILRYKCGRLYWIKNINKKYKNTVGTRAGHYTTPYRLISIYGKVYAEHRVIYTLIFGDIPKGVFIDHKDRNKYNNDVGNLRECTTLQNSHNTGLTRANTSGYKGVSFNKKRMKWVARLNINGVSKNLGVFDTPELASERYKQVVLERHFEFANIIGI